MCGASHTTIDAIDNDNRMALLMIDIDNRRIALQCAIQLMVNRDIAPELKAGAVLDTALRFEKFLKQ